MKVKIRDITSKQKKQCCRNYKRCDNCPLKPLCRLEGTEYLDKPLDVETIKCLLSDTYLDQEVDLDKPLPRKEIIAILKALDKKWKYIAKNQNGSVEIFLDEPVKQSWRWEYDADHPGFKYPVIISYIINPDLFDFLSWKDEKPTNIKKLIKEYEG